MADDVTGVLKRRKLTRKRFLWGTAGVLGAGFGFSLPERDRLVVERHTIRCPRWTAEPLRTAFLSDFHLSTMADVTRTRRAMEMALAEKPQLILLGGDFDTPRPPNFTELMSEAFRGFADGGTRIISVMGNHDYAHGRTKDIMKTCDSLGILLLINQEILLSDIRIRGLDDAMRGKPEYVFEELPNTITLLHEPDFVDQVATPVSAILCGHTHGGQICLPDGQPIHLPRGGDKYAAGLYDHAGTPIYVTRGIGMTGVTMRAFCPPEVSILTFQSV